MYAIGQENVHFVPTVSCESHLIDWRGKTAYVQYTLAKGLDDDTLGDQPFPRRFECYHAIDFAFRN